MKKQIIATSAGFAISPRNKRMDRYILSQVDAIKPKICFIPTASGDSANYIQRFYNFFNKEACIPDHLPLFKGKTTDLKGFLLAQDILYVGGGNTRNMMILWKEWGVDKILKEAYDKGILLCGISAGSLCWYEQGLTDSIPGQLMPIDCLGLIKGSNSSFFNSDLRKAKIYPDFINQQKMKAGIASDIGVGLHYIDGDLYKVMADRKGANAYVFAKKNGKVQSKRLHTEVLKVVKS